MEALRLNRQSWRIREKIDRPFRQLSLQILTIKQDVDAIGLRPDHRVIVKTVWVETEGLQAVMEMVIKILRHLHMRAQAKGINGKEKHCRHRTPPHQLRRNGTAPSPKPIEKRKWPSRRERQNRIGGRHDH